MFFEGSLESDLIRYTKKIAVLYNDDNKKNKNSNVSHSYGNDSNDTNKNNTSILYIYIYTYHMYVDKYHVRTKTCV